MAKISKNIKKSRDGLVETKIYKLIDAIKLAKSISFTKFDASLELAFNMNLDIRKADQQLRGALLLPNGTGKNVRVLATTNNPAKQQEAKKAGADIVLAGPELQELLQKGKFDFDVIVTEPSMMAILGRFGKALGPKGLMPNPKTGTVTQNISKTVEELKKGKANYRTDKHGNIHTMFGKVSMNDRALEENALEIIKTIKKLKPAAVKGAYIKNLTLSTTMGPSLKVEF